MSDPFTQTATLPVHSADVKVKLFKWLVTKGGFVPDSLVDQAPPFFLPQGVTLSQDKLRRQAQLKEVLPTTVPPAPRIQLLHPSGSCLIRVRPQAFEWVPSSLESAQVHQVDAIELFGLFYEQWKRLSE